MKTDKEKYIVGTSIFILWMLSIVFLVKFENSRAIKNISGTKFEELQINQLNYYKTHKDSIFVTKQINDYYLSKGFVCPWNTECHYSIKGHIKLHGDYYAYIDGGFKTRKIKFESLRIPQNLFPKEDFLIKIPQENINTYIDMEGERIISVIINEKKWYKAINFGKNEILFIDDIGNQVFLNKKFIRIKDPRCKQTR